MPTRPSLAGERQEGQESRLVIGLPSRELAAAKAQDRKDNPAPTSWSQKAGKTEVVISWRQARVSAATRATRPRDRNLLSPATNKVSLRGLNARKVTRGPHAGRLMATGRYQLVGVVVVAVVVVAVAVADVRLGRAKAGLLVVC